MTAGTESGDRARFLRTLRERLARGTPDNVAHPLPAFEGPPPAVGYAAPVDDPVAAFTKAAVDLGVTVRTVSREAMEEVLDEALDLAGAGPVAISNEPETAGIPDLLRIRGREVIEAEAGPQAVAAACLGITGAVAGIVRSGTLAVDSARSGTRLVSLLPPVHLALLNASALLPDQGAFLRPLDPRSLPSNLVLITGPSRSGDIELVLTVGVHGPGRLIVALLV